MIKKVVVVMLLFVATKGFSQKKASTYIGLGMGGLIESRTTVPGCNPKGSPQIAFTISQYYNVKSKYSVGLQFLASGQIIPTGGCENFDASTNTVQVSPNGLSPVSLLLRNRFSIFPATKQYKPYFDIGLGITTYQYGSFTAALGSIANTSLALSPEFGIEFNKFTFSIMGIFGGITPSGSGFDSFTGTNKAMKGISSQQVHLLCAYRIFRF
jgi:hypothetical protein